MTIKETEYVKTPAHYGHGVVFCSGSTDKKRGCSKDGTTLYQENHGYDQMSLTDQQISKLYAQAMLHDKDFPKHTIRIIVYEGEA